MRALILALALGLSACATGGTLVGLQTALSAAGMTVEAYCALDAEGRAEIRDRANLPHLIRCEGDPKP